jgi:hypothetical protein
MRNRQRGQFLDSQRRTSEALPQQQSKHFSRMALPLVIRSSKLNPRKEQFPQQRKNISWDFVWTGGTWLYDQ